MTVARDLVTRKMLLISQDLEAVAPIDHVRQTGLRSLLVTTKDAATTTPVVMDAVERAGGTVVSITEHRSSFDEVFAELIRKAGAAPDGAVA